LSQVFALPNGRGIRDDMGVRNASKFMSWEWVKRFAIWYGVWMVIAGWSLSNAAVGIPAAALATWAGMILTPPDERRLSLLRVARYAVGFVWQSVVAGLDVAWRVFQPDMHLHPGIVKVAPNLPEGTPRLLFRGIASLQPGSLACGVDAEGDLLFHCLDTRGDAQGILAKAQDELAGLWKEEEA
jgi:multicomponent Na+:H+ antiporter subunit E